MTISKGKSLVSSTGACEFAKKFMTEQGRVDLSPYSLKVINLFGCFVPPIHYLYLGVDYRTSVRLRGGGYRAYSVGGQDVLPTSKRWLRHWLNYLLVHLRSLRDKYGSFPVAPLWLTAPSFKALCPYRFGVVFHIVVMLKAPSGLDEKSIDQLRVAYGEDEFMFELLLRPWWNQHSQYLEWYLTVLQGEVQCLDQLLEKELVCGTWRRTRYERLNVSQYRYGLLQRARDLYESCDPSKALPQGTVEAL